MTPNLVPQQLPNLVGCQITFPPEGQLDCLPQFPNPFFLSLVVGFHSGAFFFARDAG